MRDGKEATVEAVMAEIEKDRTFVTTAGGGVTVTGGEPLLQPVFTAEILRRCKEAGLHTALDTSGFLGAGPPTNSSATPTSCSWTSSHSTSLRTGD